MNLKRIDGHTLDLDLITGNTVIDLGCRRFLFATHMRDIGCNVVCVDADPNVFQNTPTGIEIHNKAISCRKGKVIIYNSLGEGGYTSDIKTHTGGVEVDTILLEEIEPDCEYDVLKIDIEGAEYSLLENPHFKPKAKQITVEFHEHNLKELHDTYFKSVVDNLSKWYDLVYIMENNQYKYIDCLFIRR